MTDDSASAGVEIRRATATDAEELAAVYLASFKATYEFPLAHSDDDVCRWITGILLPTHEIWVAADGDGTLVGMMALSAEMLDHASRSISKAEKGRAAGGRRATLTP